VTTIMVISFIIQYTNRKDTELHQLNA